MPLGKHVKNESGRIRKERGDSLVKNLVKDYPSLRKFDPRTKLETLEKKFNVDSLSKVLGKVKNGK